MMLITVSDNILFSGEGVLKIKPGTLDTSLVEVSTHFHYNIVPVDHTTERTEVV